MCLSPFLYVSCHADGGLPPHTFFMMIVLIVCMYLSYEYRFFQIKLLRVEYFYWWWWCCCCCYSLAHTYIRRSYCSHWRIHTWYADSSVHTFLFSNQPSWPVPRAWFPSDRSVPPVYSATGVPSTHCFSYLGGSTSHHAVTTNGSFLVSLNPYLSVRMRRIYGAVRVLCGDKT